MVYRGDEHAHRASTTSRSRDANTALVAEDAGDTLHTQRNALDSLWAIRTDADYGAPGAPAPMRVLAEGRDASATIDSGFSGIDGFQNEGDNEITGIHVSDGDPTIAGLLGAEVPHPFGAAGSPWQGVLHRPARRQRHVGADPQLARVNGAGWAGGIRPTPRWAE